MKYLFFVAVSLAYAGPEFGVATVKINNSGSPASRAAGVKNGRFNAENLTFKTIASFAYGVMEFQITGPGWIESQRYDIAATVPDGTPADQVPAMLRTLLEDRFKLQAHRETVEMNIYAMTVDKGGAKFLDLHPNDPFTPHFPEGQTIRMTNGTVAHFGEYISRDLERPVVDMTGIAGQYRMLLTFVPSRTAEGGAAVSGPDLFTAIREELGLRLEPQKGRVEVVKVDSGERVPREN